MLFEVAQVNCVGVISSSLLMLEWNRQCTGEAVAVEWHHVRGVTCLQLACDTHFGQNHNEEGHTGIKLGDTRLSLSSEKSNPRFSLMLVCSVMQFRIVNSTFPTIS